MKSLLAALVLATQLAAQSGAKLEFDVASIKPNKSGLPPNGPAPNSIFPLGPGDVYVPNGGHFLAVNQSMLTYLRFAYKDLGYQLQYVLPSLPEWVRTESASSACIITRISSLLGLPRLCAGIG